MPEENQQNEFQSIINHYMSLLSDQKKHFYDYLFILEKQYASILKNNTDVFFTQTELAEQLILRMNTVQKVILPVKQYYKNLRVQNKYIVALENEIKSLQENVLLQNEKNRLFLDGSMKKLQAEIKNQKSFLPLSPSVYATMANTARIIDVNA